MRKLEEQAAEQGMRTLWKVGESLPATPVIRHHPYHTYLNPIHILRNLDPRSILMLILSSQGAKLEVESVVRETCEQILTEQGVSKEKLVLRAVALEIAAEAFLSIKKDADPTVTAPSGGGGDDYVKVETPSSKEREAGFSTRPPVPPPRPTQGQGPPHIPPRPEGESSEGKQETLHAAYKACEYIRMIAG